MAVDGREGIDESVLNSASRSGRRIWGSWKISLGVKDGGRSH